MTLSKHPLFSFLRRHWLTSACLVAALIVGCAIIHPVLAVTSRVDADILVVEGWVADAVLADAVKEFYSGHYALLLTSGLALEKDQKASAYESYAAEAAHQVIAFGANPSQVIACPAPLVTWNRTSSSARAVRDVLKLRGIVPKGINVVTAGPHARETWVAYRHIMSRETPVGIISFPNRTYDASYWWATYEGRRWVFKNIAGWTKEVLFGARS
jgi:hypothetical protein